MLYLDNKDKLKQLEYKMFHEMLYEFMDDDIFQPLTCRCNRCSNMSTTDISNINMSVKEYNKFFDMFLILTCPVCDSDIIINNKRVYKE